MLGAVAGDIIGSRFEFARDAQIAENAEFGTPPRAGFALFAPGCRFTDDTVLTLAICRALRRSCGRVEELPAAAVRSLREFSLRYPSAGYGERFLKWVLGGSTAAYGSMGNGSAMRVSGCAYAADSLKEALLLSDAASSVTHNHPEAIKGARAVTAAVFLAGQGSDKNEIRRYIEEHFYRLSFTLDEIRPYYFRQAGLGTCPNSVPQALQAFFESSDFESAIRLAVGLGGDADTLAAIAGAVAGAFYGVPQEIAASAQSYLDSFLLEELRAFEDRFSQEKSRESSIAS